VFLIFEGSLIIPFIYDSVKQSAAKTFITYGNNKCGLIDQYGKILLLNQYDIIEPVNASFLSVRTGNRSAFYSFFQNRILDQEYSDIGYCGESLAYAMKKGAFGFLNAEEKKSHNSFTMIHMIFTIITHNLGNIFVQKRKDYTV